MTLLAALLITVGLVVIEVALVEIRNELRELNRIKRLERLQ